MEPVVGSSRRWRVSPGTGLVLAVWLIVFGLRPFVLGFYHDDWSVLVRPIQQYGAFSPGLLGQYARLYANRPLLGLVTYLSASVCGDRPVLWHVEAAVLALLSALALRRLFRSLLDLAGWERSSAADWAAATWLTFPWMLGVTAWPTLAVTLLGLMAFALSGDLLLRSWVRGERAWALPALLFLCSGLTYETFYGQWLVYLLIGLLCDVGLRRILPAALAYMAAQTLMLVWNRASHIEWLHRLLGCPPSKSFYADWPVLLQSQLLGLSRVRESVVEVVGPLTVVSLILAVGCVLVWGCGAIRRGARVRQARTALLVLVCALGAFISVVVLSLAGYGLEYRGLGSRTTVGPSFWFAAATAAALSPVMGGGRSLRTIGSGLMAALCGILVCACGMRVSNWAETWKIERRVLAKAPVEDLATMKPDTWVLYTGPTIHEGVIVFGAWWDINAAVQYTYPAVKFAHIAPLLDGWYARWDGKVLNSTCLFVPREASEVWIWEYPSGRVQRPQPPLVLPPPVPAAPAPVEQAAPSVAPALEPCLVRYGSFSLISFRVDNSGRGLRLVTCWQKQRADSGEYVVAAHLVNHDYTFFVNIDHALEAGVGAFARMQVGDVVTAVKDLPPGEWCEKAEYVEISLYDVKRQAALPFVSVYGAEPSPERLPRIKLPSAGSSVPTAETSPASRPR